MTPLRDKVRDTHWIEIGKSVKGEIPRADPLTFAPWKKS